MPHLGLPQTGFQALILCGPGASLNTFTSIPEEFPKALVPVANRPMVWYPMDWCYRLGITNITLITSPTSHSVMKTALSQNPHLTSIQFPTPTLLAPADLSPTTGTAELLRLPEVQACIKTDFIVLPCDLICDLPGQSLLEAWMMTQGSLDGTADGSALLPGSSSLLGLAGEKVGRRGGLGVWYPLPTNEEKIKDEVADFLVTAPLSGDEAPPVQGSPATPASVRAGLHRVTYTMPMDTLKDSIEEKKALFIRYSLLKKHGRIKILTGYRDAHIYFFPYWVKEMALRNEKFQSISEDLLGWWAKAGWQKGLAAKLGIQDLLSSDKDSEGKTDSRSSGHIEEEIDLMSMSTTKSTREFDIQSRTIPTSLSNSFHAADDQAEGLSTTTAEKINTPPLLGYVSPSKPSMPLIRRVDNSALLLSISLRLAKLDAISDSHTPNTTISPLAHTNKIAYPPGIAQRCTISKSDCLLAENVTVEDKCIIKESVIGANCHIASGARLTRCLLMDGAVVGERCQLIGCIVGRRSKLGRDCVLKDCEVQNGNIVPDETDAKNEKFMIFEGLDDDMSMVGEGTDMSSNEKQDNMA
ncbi:Translation initiation factor eIF-2B subunit gamma [Microsporum ferrugineum]